MRFDMPKNTEKTLLEKLCEKYGVTLNTFEWTLLNKMPVDKIEVILQFELTKALMTAQHKVSNCLSRINMLDKQYRAIETSGNDDACMKILAEIEHLNWTVERTGKLIKYLGTLG